MKTQNRRRRFRWAREFYALAKPYWSSEERWVALAYLLTIVAINLTIVYLSVRLNRWYQQFYDVVASQNTSSYFSFLAQYCWIAAIWGGIGRVGSYLRFRLKLRWREWMTRRFMVLWLEDQNHYFCQLTQKSTDNPDQRISQDIPYFIDTTMTLTLDLLDRLVTLISFIGVLWGLSGALDIALSSSVKISVPGYLVWISLIYAAVASGLVFVIGRALVPLQYEQQHREADFRFSLMKIRENSESIALARGENTELKSRINLFSIVVKNYRLLIRKFIQVEIFENIHDQTRAIFPMFAAAPRLLSESDQSGWAFSNFQRH